jgi:hypothetical protein
MEAILSTQKIKPNRFLAAQNFQKVTNIHPYDLLFYLQMIEYTNAIIIDCL